MVYPLKSNIPLSFLYLIVYRWNLFLLHGILPSVHTNPYLKHLFHLVEYTIFLRFVLRRIRCLNGNIFFLTVILVNAMFLVLFRCILVPWRVLFQVVLLFLSLSRFSTAFLVFFCGEANGRSRELSRGRGRPFGGGGQRGGVYAPF